MNIETLTKEAKQLIIDNICAHDTQFMTVGTPTLLTASDDLDHAEWSIQVTSEYGNCKNTHTLHLCWNPEDGHGFPCDEDCDSATPVTPLNLMQTLYWDFALTGLEEKYQH
ncbi:MAG: hypothetical protein OIF57_08630 [Marinobacterium sp.]|nr:hypothetical protein [Marinobacterium sp.]